MEARSESCCLLWLSRRPYLQEDSLSAHIEIDDECSSWLPESDPRPVEGNDEHFRVAHDPNPENRHQDKDGSAIANMNGQQGAGCKEREHTDWHSGGRADGLPQERANTGAHNSQPE